VRADEVVAELGVNVKSAQPVFHSLLPLRGRLCVISQLQSHGAIFTNAPIRVIATLAHLPAQSTTNTQDATCSGTRRRLEPNCPSENLSLRATRQSWRRRVSNICKVAWSSFAQYRPGIYRSNFISRRHRDAHHPPTIDRISVLSPATRASGRDLCLRITDGECLEWPTASL
jgi:hypothetical protein